ncbi:hypothetical protein CDAR_529341 [Caerostris darwini]|uniref:Uncharacterized protein n=1 Tax=Caerostris darwini TaxID=1538125 RepID=A0AAV4TV71_9ARAC|nr:hypothetical protein CDAR_529341 [Caerostris darwini]
MSDRTYDHSGERAANDKNLDFLPLIQISCSRTNGGEKDPWRDDCNLSREGNFFEVCFLISQEWHSAAVTVMVSYLEGFWGLHHRSTSRQNSCIM